MQVSPRRMSIMATEMHKFREHLFSSIQHLGHVIRYRMPWNKLLSSVVFFVQGSIECRYLHLYLKSSREYKRFLYCFSYDQRGHLLGV